MTLGPFQREDEPLGGAGVDPSGLLLRAGHEPRDRRALVPTVGDGFGSVWLFSTPAAAELEWAFARECFMRTGRGLIDSFLGTDAALDLHETAYRLYVTNLGEFETGPRQSDDEQRRRQGATAPVSVTRDDHRLLLPVQGDHRLPRLAEWLSRMDRLAAFLAERLPELRTRLHRSKPMLAIYPGGGAQCARHVDNPTGRNGRVLSATLYLNPGWMVHDHSGCLRLWTQDQSSPAEVIAPLLDRLVFFWSDGRTPQAVDPAYRDRLAVSVWYSDATCAGVCSRCNCETTRRCCSVFYCSKECQLADWKNHKSSCVRRTKR